MEKNLDTLLKFRATATPERRALITANQTLTYAMLNRQATIVATWLLQRGLKTGDRIAILDFNSITSLLLWLGAQKIGVVAVYANWRFSPRELDFIIEDSESKLFFYGAAFAPLFAELKNKIDTIKIEELAGEFEASAEKVATANQFTTKNSSTEVLIQIYTSGTTGYPKGVLATHHSLISMASSVAPELPGFGADSCNLIAAPLFNIAGAGYLVLCIYAGIEAVLMEKFDPAQTAEFIERYSVTNVFLAPAMIHALLALPDLNNYSFASLRNIHYGGSPISRTLLLQASERFQCDFTQGYGLTETSGITTLLRFDDHRRGLQSGETSGESERLASAGRVVSGMSLAILNPDNTPAAPGEPGEVCIRGSNLTNGYWKRDGNFTDSDGWFHSGDIGRVDGNGFLYLLDRKNDMIISGGVNIFPAEIENLLQEHPAISEAAAVGVPDEKFGEKICAFIVCPDTKPEPEELKNWLSDKIAKFKIPAQFEYSEALPRNPSGKVLRRELRDPFWKDKTRQIQ